MHKYKEYKFNDIAQIWFKVKTHIRPTPIKTLQNHGYKNTSKS